MNRLGPQEIEVWYYALQPLAGHEIKKWLAVLSEEEKARYHRFRFDRDRVQFAAAHALVRMALSEYVSVAPTEWRFDANRWGKPSILNIEGKGQWGFNLSHTHGVVACAIARTESLGLDVERIDRATRFGEIARSCFSSVEVSYLESTDPQRQHDTFTRLWTLKEAYIKARGQGLSIPLDSFSFHFKKNGKPEIQFLTVETGTAPEWAFFEFQPTSDHRLAVAVAGSKPESWTVKFRGAAPLLNGLDGR